MRQQFAQQPGQVSSNEMFLGVFLQKKGKMKTQMPVIFKKASNNPEAAKCGMRGEYLQRCTHLVAIFFNIQANTMKRNILYVTFQGFNNKVTIIILPIKKKLEAE